MAVIVIQWLEPVHINHQHATGGAIAQQRFQMAHNVTAIAQPREPICHRQFQGAIKFGTQPKLIAAAPDLIAHARAQFFFIDGAQNMV